MGKAEDRIVEGRLFLRSKSPYFYTALMSLIMVPTEETTTCFVTKGRVMGYNPNFFASKNHEEVAALLWHEVSHIKSDDLERMSGPGWDPDLRNKAQDATINDRGIREGWKIPPEGIFPKNYGFPSGLTAFEYYRLFQQRQQQQAGGGGDKNGKHACGGICGNASNQELEDRLDQEYGRSPSEIKALDRQTARDILEYEKKHGTLAGGWTEWAKARLAPSKTPWDQHAASLIRTAMSMAAPGGGIEYSYQYISPRSYAQPPGTAAALKPGLMQFDPEVAIALDTSASMSIQEEIPIALREIKKIVRTFGQMSAWLFEADTEIACEPKRVSVAELDTLKLHGRGGTSFIPVFKALERMREKPSVLVYLTDGYGPAPKLPPKDMEVIWCLVGRNTAVPAPWGKVVRVER